MKPFGRRSSVGLHPVVSRIASLNACECLGIIECITPMLLPLLPTKLGNDFYSFIDLFILVVVVVPCFCE